LRPLPIQMRSLCGAANFNTKLPKLTTFTTLCYRPAPSRARFGIRPLFAPADEVIEQSCRLRLLMARNCHARSSDGCARENEIDGEVLPDVAAEDLRELFFGAFVFTFRARTFCPIVFAPARKGCRDDATDERPLLRDEHLGSVSAMQRYMRRRE